MIKITKEMTIIEIRTKLQELGWNSEDRLSNMGWEKSGYSIWFFRWNWQGKRVDRISIHGHTSNLEKIDNVVYETALKAIKAMEEHIDTVPTVNTKGQVVVDDLATELFNKR